MSKINMFDFEEYSKELQTCRGIDQHFKGFLEGFKGIGHPAKAPGAFQNLIQEFSKDYP